MSNDDFAADLGIPRVARWHMELRGLAASTLLGEYQKPRTVAEKSGKVLKKSAGDTKKIVVSESRGNPGLPVFSNDRDVLERFMRRCAVLQLHAARVV